MTIHTAALTTPTTARCTQTREAIKVTLESIRIYLKGRYINIQQSESCGGDLYVHVRTVEWRMKMMLTLTVFLTALTATSGEDAHTTCSERYLWREGVTM